VLNFLKNLFEFHQWNHYHLLEVRVCAKCGRTDRYEIGEGFDGNIWVTTDEGVRDAHEAQFVLSL
jgi:hypothetical protein